MKIDPPKVFEILLHLVLRDGIVGEDIRGSLRAEFLRRLERSGRPAARRWYGKQAFGIVLRVWAGRIRTGDRSIAPDTTNFDARYTMNSAPSGSSTLASWISDVRYALRGMRRSKGSTAIAIVTMALGIGANTAMFSFVKGILWSKLPLPEPDRVVQVWPEKRISIPMAEELASEVESFAHLAVVRRLGYTLRVESATTVVSAAVAGVELFDVLGIGPELGRGFDAGDAVGADGSVVVLSHEIWRERFGEDPDIIGRVIDLSGAGVTRRRVIGVLPVDFPAVVGSPSVWSPAIVDPALPEFQATYGASLFGRLADGVSVERASAEVRTFTTGAYAERHPTQFREVRYSPIDVLPLQEVTVRDTRAELLLLFGAVGLILLIACTNVANILLARGAARQSEIGLRLALGAERGRVTRMVLCESVALGLAGGVAGVLASAAALPWMVARVAGRMPRVESVGLDLGVLLFALGASIATGLLFGVGPAIRAGRLEPASIVGESARSGGPGRRRLRLNDALVTAEVALSVILVLSAGLMLKSLWRLSSVDPGFHVERILSVGFVVPPVRYDSLLARNALVDDVTARVSSIPGVESASVTTALPLSGSWSGIPYIVEGQTLPDGTASVVGSRMTATDRYFELMDMPIVRGRSFSQNDEIAGETAIVINEAMAERHWADSDPIGATILSSDGEFTFGRVVGVVGNIRQVGLDELPYPEFYFRLHQVVASPRYLLVRTAGDPALLESSVRSILAEVDPDIAIVEAQTMEEVLRDETGTSRFYLGLFGAFAALALLLGVIGVYGVMAFAVSQRTREIGVRVALGASRFEVLTSTLRMAMGPVGLGIVVGVVGALAAGNLMRSLLYEVAPTDPVVLVGVVAVIAAAGALASLVPALRAARLDPVGALRGE